MANAPFRPSPGGLLKYSEQEFKESFHTVSLMPQTVELMKTNISAENFFLVVKCCATAKFDVFWTHEPAKTEPKEEALRHHTKFIRLLEGLDSNSHDFDLQQKLVLDIFKRMALQPKVLLSTEEISQNCEKAAGSILQSANKYKKDLEYTADYAPPRPSDDEIHKFGLDIDILNQPEAIALGIVALGADRFIEIMEFCSAAGFDAFWTPKPLYPDFPHHSQFISFLKDAGTDSERTSVVGLLQRITPQAKWALTAEEIAKGRKDDWIEVARSILQEARSKHTPPASPPPGNEPRPS